MCVHYHLIYEPLYPQTPPIIIRIIHFTPNQILAFEQILALHVGKETWQLLHVNAVGLHPSIHCQTTAIYMYLTIVPC